MLRNTLMTLLGEKLENNAVVVKVGELLIDVEAVTDERESIALVLNPDDLSDAVKQLTSGSATAANGECRIIGRDDATQPPTMPLSSQGKVGHNG